jgi:hypothetical protein
MTARRLGGVSIGTALMIAVVALACAGSDGPPRAGSRIALPALSGLSKRPAHLLVVSVAGLTPDRYRGAVGPAPVMPTLAAMAGAGVAVDGVHSVAPASTYPAHATLVSGQLPAAHGIPADRLLGDRGVRESRYWHASHLRAPTLWQLAGQARLRVAALAWPSTLGASISLLLPDIVPTRRGEKWLGVLEDSTTPELLDLARAAGAADAGADRPGAARDAVLAEIACRLLTSSAPPALLLLRLSQTEPALAAHGPGSPEVLAAFRRTDGEIARLLDCLEAAGRAGASAIVAVGDHGIFPTHTRIAPNAVLARGGLLRAGGRGGDEVEEWSAIARSNGGSAFVYARDDRSAVSARRALAAESERSRAFRVVSAEEMLGLGADPDAWFGLEAEPGFAFGDSPRPPLLRPEARRGAGGYLPRHREMNAGLVAWGRGFRSGVRVAGMRQTDVAPTLARLLGLELGEVDGRPLVGILIGPGPDGERTAGER